MKIKYMTQEALNIFKSNPKAIDKIIKETGNKSWMNSILPNTSFKESKIEVDSLLFVIDDKLSPLENDFINAKMLYEALKHINETQASDESLWTGIALNEGYDYMMYRWGFDHSTKFEYRWNFYTKGKRGYIHHGIARLWWFAHMTFDASRNDPYELTEYGLINQSYLTKLAYRNYSNSPRIVHAVLSAMKECDEQKKITYNHTVELYKEVSLFGSVSIIDAYSDEDLKSKIKLKLKEITQ